jgi:hypothetical protein
MGVLETVSSLKSGACSIDGEVGGIDNNRRLKFVIGIISKLNNFANNNRRLKIVTGIIFEMMPVTIFNM